MGSSRSQPVLASNGHQDDAATGWRPINSAPKDGKAILIGHADGWVNEARWIEYDRIAGNGGGWFDANTHPTDATDGESRPSHWMPLPEPPSSEA